MLIKKIINIKFIFALSLIALTTPLSAKTVQYKLKIHEKTVNFTGKDITALGINDQIPAPTIEATVGDTLEVTVENTLDEDSSIHWHGLLLPNDQDGVPYLTTQPIKAHSVFKYKFKVRHSGTYWYHSHSGLQEQRGIYGSIVFHPKAGERHLADKDHVIVLSDWTNENPDQVLANIKKDGDWYALKKGSVQSWDRVLANGLEAIKNRINSSWTRMGPMDLSDVGYDAFLSNGKKENTLDAKPGQIIKLRLINAGASTYFNVEFAGEPMIVVASDGVDIEPIKVKRLRISMAETYDVLIKVPAGKSYELRATAQDGTGYSSTFIGSGEKVFAPDIPRPNLFLVDHSMHDMKGMDDMNGMDHDMSSMKHTSAKAMINTEGVNHSKHAMKPPMDHSKMDHDMSPMKYTTAEKMPKTEGLDYSVHTMTASMDHSKMGHDASAMKNNESHAKMTMDHSAHAMKAPMDHSKMDHGQHQMMMPKIPEKKRVSLPIVKTKTIAYLSDYKNIKSLSSTSLPKGAPERLVKLELTGNMERYVWSLNNKTLKEKDTILIRKGENVKFVLINKTMMNHPMHLHGHFFRVLNGQGDKSPLKHTVNVAPMETVEIEFEANEEKDWFFHCHNLYHAKTGMARVVRYSDYDGNPEFNTAKKKSREIMDDDWYPRSDILLSSQFTELGFRLSNARHTLLFSGEEHYDENETEAFAHYQYRQSRWLQYYMGVEHEEHENEVVAGLKYTTPFLIETATWISDDGDLHIEAETEFPLTPKLNLELMASTDSEWELSLAYRRSPNWAMSLSANDISGLGLGFSATF